MYVWMDNNIRMCVCMEAIDDGPKEFISQHELIILASFSRMWLSKPNCQTETIYVFM